MEQHNISGSSESSVYLGIYNQHKSYQADNTISQSTQSITTEPITIDFTASVISLSISSHYFVSNTTHSNVDTERFTEGITAENSTHFPLFLRGYKSINVPNKTEAVLRRHVSKRRLLTIHEDHEVAIELCLLFLSNLTDTHFRILGLGFETNEYNQAGWKSLSSEILRSQFRGANTYKRIIEVLKEGTSKGPIIECDEIDQFGQKCYGYRLGESYRMKGVTNYELNTDYVRDLQSEKLNARVREVRNNSISHGLLELYPLINLPNYVLVEEQGINLSKSGYMTKKGKRLTCLNKNSRSYWKNPEDRTFVEDHMEIFYYLTEGGVMIPTPGGDRSGGRVVDSFTLMPSWQRNMLQIEGEEIVMVDYSCLHPNLCVTMYGGTKQYLTHDFVSTMSGLPKPTVKLEHLSFFNKRYEDMLRSDLWNYYVKNESEMLGNIVREKGNGMYGHKETSRNLFRKEVEIMKDVYTQLRWRGIPAGYVYDALFCKKSDAQEVRRIMNNVAHEHGVYTTAKIDLG